MVGIVPLIIVPLDLGGAGGSRRGRRDAPPTSSSSTASIPIFPLCREKNSSNGGRGPVDLPAPVSRVMSPCQVDGELGILGP